ncbi:hypothetical protein [Chryseobacterium luquanense]|uniref:Uncharacterized protein n=1 Tax=Chryseobacterium luquanense TaxID=2983766 RepID=A0ABT3XYA0_9FLAO|nr:hypothetical protein [Chryseobacterium luquanense]MCX8530874.1 hypothetical protein [Chryseobacterium luquanense]
MIKKNRAIKESIRFSRARYQMIVSEKKLRKKAYSQIISTLAFPKLCESIDFLEKNIPGNKQTLIWGNPLPKIYSELGNVTEIPYLGDNLEAELNLCLIGIRKFKYEISLFLKYKEIFENYLILGEYIKAEKQLSKIEEEICVSLWSLENRFVLKELSGKASENKEYLSSFNKENNSYLGITKSLAHYLSLRAEHSLSVNRYYNELEGSLLNMKDSKNKEAFQNYYRFKLTFNNHTNFKNYGEIISLDFSHSIIDRYLTIVRIITNLLAVSNYLETETEKTHLRNYLLSRINYLIRKVNDPVLFKLKLLCGDRIFPAFESKKGIEEIRIIDNYTSGLYDVAEKEIKIQLLENPAQFDLYILYIKSLIYQKKPFIYIGNKKSIQNEILENLYRIISVNYNPHQSAAQLLRIANNIISSSISYGITDFVFYQTHGKDERKLLSKLSYSAANPAIHEVFKTDEEKLSFLHLLHEKFPDSLTINFFLEKLKGIEDIKKFEKKIPEVKYKVELAKWYQENDNFIDAITEWEYLINHYKETPPILETAVINLFHCYLMLNQLNKCIDLYVNSFFLNNYIVDKIETKNLLLKIRLNKFREVDKGINLPIFYALVDADEIESHIAFEQFNRHNGAEKPSELIKNISNFEESKFLWFLLNCCVPKILMHSTFINNSKERLEERLSIMNFLKEKMPDNNFILSEIKSIENILVIQQGLIDLDESKIYVNEQGIFENELQEFKAIYERFKIIADITGNNKLLFLEGGKLTTFISNENTELEKIEYSNNPVFEIYSELFTVIKDKFLNSQFGIVAYLSTRIRHGVLVGELRPVFETHKLITLKEGSSSNYRKNLYWDVIYSDLQPDVKEQIQIILNDFSSKIDGLIFDLIKKHLQVYKPEINDEGWFNYEFDDNNLWYHSIVAIGSGNFENFVQGIFNVLWERTDENLTFIRSKIQEDILVLFNKYFKELELSIVHLLGDYKSQELVKEIKDCSTEVQMIINKISRWFKRSEVKASNFSLSELINIVLEYTNKSSWHKELIVSQNIQYNCIIRGEFKTHFADLIRIFLENIIKHSTENIFDIECKITTDMANDILTIIIENEISDMNQLDHLKNIWKNNQPDVNKLLNEGKSGYHKAFKILKSDLKCTEADAILTNVSEDNKIFSVKLKINIKELKE